LFIYKPASQGGRIRIPWGPSGVKRVNMGFLGVLLMPKWTLQGFQ